MDARTFGVEIEFIGNAGAVSEAMARQGITCHYEGYNHENHGRWKIVYDASVCGRDGNGLELVSPPLSGEEGLAEVKKACEALDEAGAKVNRTCGLHVHHYARDLTIKHFKNLYEIYYRYEDTIDSLVPGSRRGNYNIFCRSIRENVRIEMIRRMTTIEQMKVYFSGCMPSGQEWRYLKLNFKAYIRHGTIEFRQHSGTIEFKKIANWIKLTRAMINKAVEAKRIQGNDGWDQMRTLLKLRKCNGGDDEAVKLNKFYTERRKRLAERLAA